jgi:hypothetical protein
MSTTAIIIIIAVLVVLLLAAVGWSLLSRRRLQERFGPEYDRVVAENPNRTAAERELRGREQRHAKLDLRSLNSQERQQYSAEWARIQQTFVEQPSQAVTAADALITRVMAARGYPTADYDERLSTLSVEHARTLDHYRQAHDISILNTRGDATTEQLRQAVVHYRALASDLLDADADEPADARNGGSANSRNDRPGPTGP